MSDSSASETVARDSVEVDIACVGFGPAMGGFLTTLSSRLDGSAGTPLESRVMPGMPLQVLCYERAGDPGFGVSGVVTRARGIQASFPDLDPESIPTAAPVKHEKVVHLLDPVGASRRCRTLRAAEVAIRVLRPRNHAFELPYIPPFLRKEPGILFSIGQFNQWVASRIMGTGAVQIWPGSPVSGALMEDDRVVGIRLQDQGVDRHGQPDQNYMPGMDIRAPLTVVGDGPVGAVGMQLDQHFGMPAGNHRHEWAVGAKVVVDLPADTELEPGTVIHTLGYPEPEIFGFLYVNSQRVASAGIFIPSWFRSPVRNSYRYLQHWMLHPYLWRHLQGGTMRSWGAKTLLESGRRGEPHLVGDGFARIGEGSGSTNVLTGSGVDEAWTTGHQLAECVIELLESDEPFTREKLEAGYVKRRRTSWVEREARAAEKARDGFQRGFVAGVMGMGLSGISGGRLNVPGKEPRLPPLLEDYYRGLIDASEIKEVIARCNARNTPLYDALMDRAGWPAIPFDGKLLVSHQDALLMGGKVQAPPGYADHVVFRDPEECRTCENRLCIEICSGQAITPGSDGIPAFDREKCVHCGACVWNCIRIMDKSIMRTNVSFTAGAGGLHSAEN